MSSHTHYNPIFSVIYGIGAGVFAYFQNHLSIEDLMELLKVISYGLLGGACGYIGRILMQWLHLFLKRLKEESKKACK